MIILILLCLCILYPLLNEAKGRRSWLGLALQLLLGLKLFLIGLNTFDVGRNSLDPRLAHLGSRCSAPLGGEHSIGRDHLGILLQFLAI